MMGGTMYFYYNTVRANQSGGSVQQFDVSRGQSMLPTVWPSVNAVNNAFSIENAGGSDPDWDFAASSTDRVSLGVNWATNVWSNGDNGGLDSSRYLNDPGDYHQYQTAADGSHVTGAGNTVSGSSRPFDLTTWKPITGSPLTGAAAALPAGVQRLAPQFNYQPSTQTWAPRPGLSDIGAESTN